jgi:hypothetical protein
LGALLVLAGCGRSFMLQGERPAWRHQAEAQCMQSGAIKLGAGVVQIKPIEGPGMCGADFPLKVAALGETGSRLGYSDVPRPPGSIANSSQMPQWPPTQARYAQPMVSAPPQPPPVATVNGQQLRWTPGAPAIDVPQTTAPQTYPRAAYPAEPYPVRAVPSQPYPQRTYAPQYDAQDRGLANRPMSIHPQGAAQPRDDIPDDAILPPGRAMPRRPQPAYNAPPALGPVRGPQVTGAIVPATLKPAATLSCPIVSALERWVTDGVQPAALHWFGSQVVEIKQISAYSCRQMNGAGGHGISEHAFGNALDVAGFTLADGRKISVQHGWKGSPEEQGFLHDVQLYACETFVTVLAPGYNAAHYNHFHVDLQRRKNGRRPCRPAAIKGEVVAARARAVYASKHGGAVYTGSIARQSTFKSASDTTPQAVPGEDGLDEEDGDDNVTGSISTSVSAKTAYSTEPGADGEFDADDVTGSINAGRQTGWPRLAPISSGAIH